MNAFAFVRACTLTPTPADCWIVQHKGMVVLVARQGGKWAAFDKDGTALVTGRTREAIASFGLDLVEMRREEIKDGHL